MGEPDLRPLLVRCGLFLVACAGVGLGLVGARRPEAGLRVPVQGVSLEDLRDSFREPRRGGRRHGAIDIPAARGTPVIAADDGVVDRLDESPRGGLAVYQWDDSRERCFYYGHLDGYRDGLTEGEIVRRGETLGFVGTSGNAPENAPHLHFEIRVAEGETGCGGGRAVNPFGALSER